MADVTQEPEVRKAVEKTMEVYGQIDFLVNNAGVAISGAVWELPVQDWEWIVGAKS